MISGSEYLGEMFQLLVEVVFIKQNIEKQSVEGILGRQGWD